MWCSYWGINPLQPSHVAPEPYRRHTSILSEDCCSPTITLPYNMPASLFTYTNVSLSYVKTRPQLFFYCSVLFHLFYCWLILLHCYWLFYVAVKPEFITQVTSFHLDQTARLLLLCSSSLCIYTIRIHDDGGTYSAVQIMLWKCDATASAEMNINN